MQAIVLDDLEVNVAPTGRRMQWAVLCVLVYLLYCCWFQVNQVALGGLHEPAFISSTVLLNPNPLIR
ncbi:hypothetical protein FDU21_14250 [Xanthomonas oryzae pv. oryzae]|nr:hypothetical protein FDU21_14250 [Xanthomonas oryzae pv. oryzae]